MPTPDDLVPGLSAELDDLLAQADRDLAERYPGDTTGRQPVHTLYVPADRVTSDLAPRCGEEALQVLAEHEGVLAGLLGARADDVLPLVADKLGREPVEDLRVDLEDGYGRRPDDVEDADVDAAVTALAEARAQGTAPPFVGARVKSLEAPTRARGVRTLTRFVTGMVEAGAPLDDVVVTLPKVTSVDQVAAMVHACSRLEGACGLTPGSVRFEIQVETPQSVLGPDGTALVARMVHAGEGRVTALHYGTYDYSAFCGVPGPYQSLEHPVADHAKLVMQAAAAGTGVRLSDGSTNVLPVGDPDRVREAWALHLRLVRRALERGYPQGWDLHPAQLPSRYAATYAFYREHLAAAGARLRDYLQGRSGGVLDEPATARALADLVVRALDCGAVTASEAERATGTGAEELLALARPRRS